MPGLDQRARRHRRGGSACAKFRTGGPTAEAVPDDAELAAFIAPCLDRGSPFKLTAGLHHAVRYTETETGFEHHGFLNVLARHSHAPLDGAAVHDVVRGAGHRGTRARCSRRCSGVGTRTALAVAFQRRTGVQHRRAARTTWSPSGLIRAASESGAR